MRLTRLVLLAAIGSAALFSPNAPAADLSGTVRGPDGAPVASALVAAIVPSAARPAATQHTDAAGSFRFRDLPTGRYGLTVTAAGLEAAYRAPIAIEDGPETRLDVVLASRGKTLSGAVSDNAGKPVAARVLAARIGAEAADLFVGEADASGRFALTLPEARYIFTFVADGFEPEDMTLDSAKAKPMSVRLTRREVFNAPAPEPVLEEVRAAAIPLTTVEAGHGFSDMEPLRKVVGPARIVALGEATHGTREFFQLKHRMLEFLVSEMGFDVFAIEANWPEALAVDDYVMNGRGDPTRALAGLHFWTWNTEEVLDLIRWMRRWNEDPAHTRKIRFAGVDMQFPPVAAKAVRDYLAPVEPAWSKSLTEPFDLLMGLTGPNPRSALLRADAPKLDALREAVEELGTRMDARHAELAAKTSEAAWRLARQHARILAQFEETVREPGENVRDRAMAENAAWVLDAFGPGSRMALWAHNVHVSRDPESPMGPAMGADLARRFRKELVVFGFAFDEGSFRAMGDRGPRNFTAPPAPPGSVDSMLRATGMPLFALDLRRIPSASPAGRWLGTRRPTRSIFSFYSESAADQYFARQRLAANYDALFFVAKTSAARPNPISAPAPVVKMPPASPAAVNLGFEDGPAAGAPAGWGTSKQAAEEGWSVVVTDQNPREGKFAACIARSRADAPRTFGNLMQRIDAAPWRGKRIRLRAAVRAEVEGTDGQAQLWLRVDRPGGTTGFLDYMGDRPIRDPEWRFYEIEGNVAEDAEAIAFGLLLKSGGKAYVDSFSLTASPDK